MKTLILTLISVSLVNNVVLSQFLGLCPFLGVSKQTKTALSMGGAVIFVITIASAVTHVLYRLLVLLHVEYLETVTFILIIAALVQLVELFLKKYSTALYNALGVYLPLITTNCAVLGVALTNVQNHYNFITSVVAGFGTALGFTISITILAGIRERIADNDIPHVLQGSPIVLITAGLMAIAFIGFSGLILGGMHMIISILVVGIIGLLIGILLSLASIKFEVKVDENEEKIRAVLPGNNCGACGYPGCDGLACAIAKKEAPINQCPVGGEEVAKKIGEIMHLEVETMYI